MALLEPVLFAHVQELVAALGKIDPELKAKMDQEFAWSVQVTNPSGTPQMQGAAIGNLISLGENPETGISTYEAVSRYLDMLERKGVTDATGLQMPQDPIEACALLLAKQGVQIDPQVLALHIQEAAKETALIVNEQQQMAAGQPGNGQGMGPEQGPGVLSLLSAQPPGGQAGTVGA